MWCVPAAPVNPGNTIAGVNSALSPMKIWQLVNSRHGEPVCDRNRIAGGAAVDEELHDAGWIDAADHTGGLVPRALDALRRRGVDPAQTIGADP